MQQRTATPAQRGTIAPVDTSSKETIVRGGIQQPATMSAEQVTTSVSSTSPEESIARAGMHQPNARSADGKRISLLNQPSSASAESSVVRVGMQQPLTVSAERGTISLVDTSSEESIVFVGMRQSAPQSRERRAFPMHHTSLASFSVEPSPSASPSHPTFDILNLPAELLDEIFAHLFDPEKKNRHYACYWDPSCYTRLEKPPAYRLTWNDRSTERPTWGEPGMNEALLGWASTCKVARALVMPTFMKMIGFNICPRQLNKIAEVSQELKEMVRGLVIHHDGRIHEAQLEVTSDSDRTETEREEYNDDGVAGEHELRSQGSEVSHTHNAQQAISFIDFIRRFPNAKSLWISFHPDWEEEEPLLISSLQDAADECDRKRQDPGQAMTRQFPSVEFLSLSVEWPLDWTAYLDEIKLRQLKLTLKQLDLPNLRVWHLNLDEMLSFHLPQHLSGHEQGETSWRLLSDALGSAMCPTLRELHIELEFKILESAFGINLCDEIERLLGTFRPSDNIRISKLSVILELAVAERPYDWRRRDDEEADDSLLDPKVSPNLARLIRVVESLRTVHPRLETFWLDFGTTEVDFWAFRFPASDEDLDSEANGDSDDDEEVDRGVTETAVVNGGETASFTFYRRNVESVVD
ncbi:hypothetical protein NCC49_003692 [Naganishia albida]|nr:hypothetical protein NCC49_003692 [Naganishia albida]